MSKATREQLERLAEYGLFKGRDMEADRAQSLIEEAEANGVKVDDESYEAGYLKISQLLKRRKASELKAARESQAKKALIAELENDLLVLDEEVRELKQDAREEKEYYNDRAKFEARRIHEQITFYKSYTKLTKKPTIAEIKAVMVAIIEQKPDWHSIKEKKLENLIVDTLRRNFKHLRTDKPRPNSKKKKESSGCLKWLILIIFCVIIYYMCFE